MTCKKRCRCLEHKQNKGGRMIPRPFWETRWQKLASAGDRYGVSCDEEGPSIGPVRLFEMTADGLAPRPVDELDFIFGEVFGCPINFAAKMTGLTVVARALDAGDLAKAMIATQLTHLPTLPDEAAFHRAVHADMLAKAGFNPAEPRDERGRWTADSASQVRVRGQPTRPLSVRVDNTDDGFNPAYVRPAQEIAIPPLEVFPEFPPLPATPPFSGDIVPPLTDTPGNALPRTLENPFPRDPKCRKEWEDAFAYCDGLKRRGLIGRGDQRNIAPSYEQCVRGQVSERCGGSPLGRRGPPRSRYDIMANA